MTFPPTGFGDLIGKMGGAATVAADLGCSAAAVRMMVARDSVGAAWWLRILRACRRRRIPGVSLQLFAAWAEQARPAARQKSKSTNAPITGKAVSGAQL